MKKQSGIYFIRNLINGKVYVGCTTDFATRTKNHITDLQANSHHNKPLQEDWNEYDESDFEFHLVESCHPDDIYEVEKKYIKVMYDEQNMCYNVATQKQINSLISPTGMVVQKIYGVREFCRKYKVRRTSLQFMLRGLRNSADGWTVYNPAATQNV
jgi:group I intron endonuclease